MHSILTQAKYVRFSGTNVPRDFVEAPSQMLEAWVWNKTVLDSFAADYKTKKKLPVDILKKMKAAKLALAGTTYRRQLSFGITDLVLHGMHKAGEKLDVVAASNRVLSDAFLPVDPSTAMVASFGHLNGYDGGYYGYAWADAIAADMATVFEKSPGGFLDKDAGMKMRNEVYAPGDSRDVSVSIEKFLGRPRSIQPFLESIGIGAAEEAAVEKEPAAPKKAKATPTPKKSKSKTDSKKKGQ
jgi:Zn-dependent oligopeptidase